MSDLKEWLKVPDYSAAVNARNGIMSVISRHPGAGVLAHFSETSIMQNVCSAQNNNGSLINSQTGQLIRDFKIWPGPVPENSHINQGLSVPRDPLSATRKALDIDYTIE